MSVVSFVAGLGLGVLCVLRVSVVNGGSCRTPGPAPQNWSPWCLSWQGLSGVICGEGEERTAFHQGKGGLTPFPGLSTLFIMDYRERITLEPGKRGGKPCIRGLRITVQDVLEYLASGMTVDEILGDFPDLTREDIQACLAFAADRERKLTSIPLG